LPAFLGLALLLAFGFGADAVDGFGAAAPVARAAGPAGAFTAAAIGALTAALAGAFGAALAGAFGAASAAALGALVAAAFVAPFTAVPLLAARAGVRAAAVLAAPRVVLVLAGAEVPLADSPFAASFSEATALSRALVALVIAASAVLSALADVPALLAAVFSRVAAELTLVAAAETVRGVAAPGLVAVVLLVVDRAVVRVLLVTVAGLAAAVRVAGLLAASVVPGTVAVVFVGTDLPLDMDQLRGRHSTESNLLHLTTRKNNGGRAIFVTIGHFSPSGTSSATIRSASCGDAPCPTATPIR
jgi:hypothetical protein